MTDEPEYLMVQREPRKARRRPGFWWWFWGVALVAVLLGADAAWRNVELDRLVTGIEAAERSTLGWPQEVTEIVDPYRSQLASGTLEEPALSDLSNDIEGSAAQRAGKLIVARSKVADVLVLPWHGPNEKAKRAYLAHTDAWMKHLRDISTSGIRITDEKPDIIAARRVAESAVRAAIPSRSIRWFHFRSRVDQIFDEEQALARRPSLKEP